MISHVPASYQPQEIFKFPSMSSHGSFSYILQSHNGKLKVIDNVAYQQLHLHSSPLLQKQFRHVAHLYSNYLALLTVDRDEVNVVGDLLNEHENMFDAEAITNSAGESDPSSSYTAKLKQALIMKLQKFDRIKFPDHLQNKVKISKIAPGKNHILAIS